MPSTLSAKLSDMSQNASAQKGSLETPGLNASHVRDKRKYVRSNHLCTVFCVNDSAHVRNNRIVTNTPANRCFHLFLPSFIGPNNQMSNPLLIKKSVVKETGLHVNGLLRMNQFSINFFAHLKVAPLPNSVLVMVA